jgi:hypothetical protein
MTVPRDKYTDYMSHKSVIHTIKNLNDFIPEKYKKYDIIEIIMPKSYAYYTGLDEKHNVYKYISMFLKTLSVRRKIANHIAYKIMCLQKIYAHKAIVKIREEIELDNNFNGQNVPIDFKKEKHKSNIFFANMQTYLRVMVLYINEDQEFNNLIIVPRSLGKTAILKKIDKSKILYFEHFINNAIFQEYLEAKKEFTIIYSENINKLYKLFSFDGYSFFPIIERGLEDIFKFAIPQAILFKKTVDRILKEINANAIIGARVRKIYDRAFYLAAKNSGIKRYTILHSGMGSDFRFIHNMGHFKDFDGIFVWGPKHKQLIEEDTFSTNSKVYVTGSPLFKRSKQNKFRQKGIKTILYACTKNDLNEIRLIVRSLRNIQIYTKLIVKVHPNVNQAPYYAFCKKNSVVLIPGSHVLEEYLECADMLMTTHSESGLQAMVSGVPVLFIAVRFYIKQFLENLYNFTMDEKKLLVAETRNEVTNKTKRLLSSFTFVEQHKKVQDKYLRKTIYLDNDPDFPVKKMSSIINSNGS